ncbi:hypothetical protein CF327_g4971 [Tilletia walkeri]|uniref:S-formylglutathione hydrolase n=1 Tax=Tilletia walkeri TaxID=117179 RepID=A0A8X7T3P1_9BASI|nr:hypothetical protein CF327_g4971 [Tilletia walkeri]KAE8267641.1 hypothetical protein A4X09_0g4701 [Tilletia walkeri]
MSTFEKKGTIKVANGHLHKFQYTSQALGNLTTDFNVFLPSTSSPSNPVPVLFYLAGLTCTPANGTEKGNFFATAEKHGIAIVLPDTSPRGAKIEGEDESWDFGSGAGFYLNATKEPWSKHYRMYDLVVKELPEKLKASDLPLDLQRTSIFGHSMGGHGALTIYLKSLIHGPNSSETGPLTYRSVSAFAPISHPSSAPWGHKAFKGYLQNGIEEGSKSYDAVELVSQLPQEKKAEVKVLTDTGDADDFYKQGQLGPEDLSKAFKEAGVEEGKDVLVRMQEGYDHSYFFIGTFAPEHIEWHAKFLKA